jgi:hypothetical protein
MKSFAFFKNLGIASLLFLILSSLKPTPEKNHYKPLLAYPPIVIKNNSKSSLLIKLNYGLGEGPTEAVVPGQSYQFPKRGLSLLYRIDVSASVYLNSDTQSVIYIPWKKGGGCGGSCANFVVNQESRIEGEKKVITFTVLKN